MCKNDSSELDDSLLVLWTMGVGGRLLIDGSRRLLAMGDCTRPSLTRSLYALVTC